jgi:DNA/RNA-binding domain of Phe-tRNA-synthetase-like protein
MHFGHAVEIWADFPELVPGVLVAEGITSDLSVGSRVARFTAEAERRLAASTEGELAEIQAWRRAFSRMGLRPTQYRCASEALLRRFRKEGALPPIHPLIDLCNAISLASAVPVAVFDLSRITDHLEVRYAHGSERYLTFAGETESPQPGEVIFVDGAGRAHARRWTNRQSGYSAVRDQTSAALVVVEAMHDRAVADVQRLTETIAGEIDAIWHTTLSFALLSKIAPRFEFAMPAPT